MRYFKWMAWFGVVYIFLMLLSMIMIPFERLFLGDLLWAGVLVMQ